MASITIRRLDERITARLRVQAARHGRSMEEEAREILKAGISTAPPAPTVDLATAIRRLIEPLGGVELEIPPRDDDRPPPDFSR